MLRHDGISVRHADSFVGAETWAKSRPELIVLHFDISLRRTGNSRQTNLATRLMRAPRVSA